MRKFSVAVVGVVLAAVVAACGGSDDTADGRQGDRERASSRARSASGSWIRARRRSRTSSSSTEPTSQAAHPGTKIDIQFVPWAQAHDKFVTAMAGGKVPDVAEMGTTWTPEFADQGGLVEQPKISKGDYVSSLVDAATLNGKVYGKPWYAGARALIYRKDMLEKAGVEPPTTWDETMAAAKAIKSKVGGGVYPVSFTGLSEHMYLPTIWQAGGQIATQDGETWKSALNSPEAAKALDYYASFYKDGLDPKAAVGWEEPDAQTAFANGDVAMLIAGGWTYNSIIATKPDLEKKIGTALTPAGPSGKNTAFAGGIAPRAVPGVQEQGPGRGVHRLHARAGPAEQVHGRDRLPAGHHRRHQGVGLSRGSAAQAVRRAAARSLRGLPAVAEVGRTGGREHLRRRDPEGDEGPGDRRSRPWPSWPRRWTRSSQGEEPGRSSVRDPPRAPGIPERGHALSSAPAAVSAGRSERLAAAGGVAAARWRGHHAGALLLPAMVIIVGLVGYPLVRTVYLSFTDTGLGERSTAGRRGSAWTTTRRSSPTSTCGRPWSTRSSSGRCA